jgi:hypothetical protein
VWAEDLHEKVLLYMVLAVSFLVPMSTYDTLHRQCRTLESLFDTKLTAYSRLAASISNPQAQDVESAGSSERWKDVELEGDELLEKVRPTPSSKSTHFQGCSLSWKKLMNS